MNDRVLGPLLGTLTQQFSAIDLLVERKLQFPTLSLIYSGIDAVAWLGGRDDETQVGPRFTSWVDRYVLPEVPLRARAIDLYAARCGILHTLTADADLITKGKAIPVCYAWGSADDTVLQGAIDTKMRGKAVAVHIDRLARGFRLGTLAMFTAADSDAALADRITRRAPRFFAQLPSDLGK
jgi:hypothetical protein